MDYGYYNREEYVLSIVKRVKICPRCQHAVKLSILGYNNLSTNYNEVGIICECANCDKIVFIEYNANYNTIDVYPKSFKAKEFEDEINNISEKFSVIYNQALQSETMELYEVCGMGYRKALEFLIKDYAKNLYPDKSDSIEKTPLKNCIEKYIDNENIKKSAIGAVYLGNDETHYIRKWEDKDLKDLKNLIDITVYWIVSNEKFKKYTEEMNLDK